MKKKGMIRSNLISHGAGGNVKKHSRFLFAALISTVLVLCMAVPVLATGGDPLTVVNNLSTFIFGLIRAVGIIILAWGVVPAKPGLSDIGGRSGHYVCKGDPYPDRSSINSVRQAAENAACREGEHECQITG